MRFFIRIFAVLASVYVIVLVSLTLMQRSFVFPADDGAGLAAINWQAIKGVDRFFLETPDGETLSAWYKPPAGENPTFLFFHGNGGRLDLKKWRFKRILDKGYGLMTLSYRGYPGSTGSPSEDGLLIDGRTAWQWLVERQAPENIIIHGLSLGSGVATALATEVEARALILETPFTSVEDVAAGNMPYFPVRWVLWDKFKSVDRISDVAEPLMIAHGTRDSVVPYEQGRALFKAANEPKTFVSIENGDHSTLVRDGLYEHIWPWLSSQEP